MRATVEVAAAAGGPGHLAKGHPAVAVVVEAVAAVVPDEPEGPSSWAGL